MLVDFFALLSSHKIVQFKMSSSYSLDKLNYVQGSAVQLKNSRCSRAVGDVVSAVQSLDSSFERTREKGIHVCSAFMLVLMCFCLFLQYQGKVAFVGVSDESEVCRVCIALYCVVFVSLTHV